MAEYEPVVGLEVHAQLLTRSKLFCGCSTRYGVPPNSQVCPVCMGLPGALPVLNEHAVDLATRVILALDGAANQQSVFARKGYFYPDLPKGYQISQYDQALGRGGFVGWYSNDMHSQVGLIRIHLEEDAGKLIHSTDDSSLVDLNRCGVPLIEIVSEPTIRSPEMAYEYLHALRQILQYLDVCSGDMEKGAFRCDANVSVRPAGSTRATTRTEIKNINSFRFVKRALEFEIERQISILDSGGTIEQDTLLWDEQRNECVMMRRKEHSEEYRYFPEPDLLPLNLSRRRIDDIRSSVVELPRHKQARFINDYGLSSGDVSVLTADRDLAEYFESAVRSGADPKRASNWIQTEVLRYMSDVRQQISDIPVSPQQLASLLKIIDSGELSGKLARTVFAEMIKSGSDPEEIVTAKGLRRITDEKELAPKVKMILERDRENVESYRAGKTRVLSYFIGQLMKETNGMADPGVAARLFKRYLDAPEG